MVVGNISETYFPTIKHVVLSDSTTIEVSVSYRRENSLIGKEKRKGKAREKGKSNERNEKGNKKTTSNKREECGATMLSKHQQDVFFRLTL